MTLHYSEMQIDALRELANIGSGNAATTLSHLLDRPIDIAVPRANVTPLASAVEAIGVPESLVTGVVIQVRGDLDARVLLLFAPEDAATLCGLLGVPADDEIGRSALGEVGNILGCSYIGALSALTATTLVPAPPECVADMLGAIVASALVAETGSGDLALLLDSRLHIGGAACSFAFVFIPDELGVAALLERLGVV